MPRPKDRKGHQWMRAQDAAKMLGVTRPTVLAMVAREELGSISIGGLVFVSRSDVDAKASARKAA